MYMKTMLYFYAAIQLREDLAVYQLTKAIVRRKNSKGRWVEEDLSATPVATLFNTYTDVYLILSHPSLDHLVSLNLVDVINEVAGLLDTVTVTQWLSTLGDTALPTQDGIPTVTTKQVKYNDVFGAGYKADLVFAEGSFDTEIPDSERDDVMLTRPNTDYELFYKNCLVTMNGLIHRTDFDKNGVYVKGAGKSFRVSNQNHLGLLSFREIGELDFVTITPDMVYNPHPNGKLSEAAYLKMPKSMDGKIVMLVLGGYLHVLDSYFYANGDYSIRIDTANLPWLQRFYAMKKLIDVSPMTDLYDKNPNNPDHLSVEQFFSDDSIKAFLSLSQSFVVLLDADNLYVEKHKLEYTKLPGRYYARSRPDWPLQTELGRLPEYIAIPESDIWVLAVQDNFSTRYRFESYGWQADKSVDSSRDSVWPVFFAQGHLLEIGSDITGFTPTTA